MSPLLSLIQVACKKYQYGFVWLLPWDEQCLISRDVHSEARRREERRHEAAADLVSEPPRPLTSVLTARVHEGLMVASQRSSTLSPWHWGKGASEGGRWAQG